MRVLADRVSTALAERRSQPERRYSADTWLSDYLIPAVNQFSFGGATYPFGVNFTQAGVHIHEIVSTLPGYSAALRACPPAFAAQMVRALVLSQARFTFRNRPSARTPRRLFGTSALAPLEKPWTNATTGELLARMEWHAGLAGNAYVTNRSANRLRVLRPDWVAIVYGSHQEPEQAAYALDGEIIGYVYAVGGLNAYGGQLSPMLGGKIYTLLPEEVAHWSPIPDSEGSGIGQSWITPAVKDMQSDRAATEMKLRFWAQGSTPNMVVKGLKAATKEQFDDIVNMLEERHSGIANAFKTLYLTEGADATVVGSNFREMDLKAIQGASETRVASLSRVPASLLGIAEGLAGSSLNAGNFGMARRIFADTWVYPTLQDLAAALSPMVRVPSDAELWFDVADMPLLREDGKDAAEIEAIKAETITKYVREGFTADSAIAAVRGQDVSLLVHTNLVSVQLQAPGAPAVGAAPAGPPAAGPPPDFSALRAPPGKAAPPGGGPTTRSSDDVDGEPDEQTLALIAALDELSGESRAAFDEALHPRNPKGTPGGGRFRSIVQRITDALESWSKGNGPDDPLKDFDREQLRLAAKARGLTLRRGASRDEIHAALLADLKANVKANRETPKSAKFTLQGPDHNGLDVAVYRDPQGHPALFRENDAGKRGTLVAKFDDLAGLEKWADGNGEPRLAEWARKERGGRAVPSVGTAKVTAGREAVTAAAGARLSSSFELSTTASPGWSIGEREGLARELRDYAGTGTGAHFLTVNDWLRGKTQRTSSPEDVAKLRPSVEARIARLDRVFDAAPLATDVEVWRGTSAGRAIFGDRLSGDLAGFQWPEAAYSSTTATREHALDYVGGLREPGILMRIVAPKGVGGVYVEGPADELLLQRGLTYRVVHDAGIVKEPNGQPLRHLDVEVVPARKEQGAAAPSPAKKAVKAAASGLLADVRGPARGRMADLLARIDAEPGVALGSSEDLDRLVSRGLVRTEAGSFGGTVGGRVQFTPTRHYITDRGRAELAKGAPSTSVPTAGSLAAKTIPQLRELAKQRGIKIPSGSRKADILILLSGGAPPVSKVRPSGLPTDRRPQSGDFEDLANRISGKSEQQIYETLQDLNATELGKLALKFHGPPMLVPGWNKVSARRQGLKIPSGMTVEEQRRWLAKRVANPGGLAWR